MAQESLGVIGEVENEEDLDVLDEDPIPFTLVGYEKADEEGNHKRHEFEFYVRPTAGFGPLFNVMSRADNQGKVPDTVAARFIYDSLVSEKEQQRWVDTLSRPDVDFQATAIVELAELLGVRYGMRPTRPRSERRAGPRRTVATSGAARSAKASTSGRSKQVTPST